MNKIGIPKTKIINKQRDKCDAIMENLIIYTILQDEAFRLLIGERKLSPNDSIAIRLVIEVRHSLYILHNFFHISDAFLNTYRIEFMKIHKEKFEEEVKKYVDQILPKKSLILFPETLKKNEFVEMTRNFANFMRKK